MTTKQNEYQNLTKEQKSSAIKRYARKFGYRVQTVRGSHSLTSMAYKDYSAWRYLVAIAENPELQRRNS